MLTATLANIRARLLPSFTDGLYLVGSHDAVSAMASHREANHADQLLEAVSLALELRHDEARREEGDVELQASLARVSEVVEAWQTAIRE